MLRYGKKFQGAGKPPWGDKIFQITLSSKKSLNLVISRTLHQNVTPSSSTPHATPQLSQPHSQLPFSLNSCQGTISPFSSTLTSSPGQSPPSKLEHPKKKLPHAFPPHPTPRFESHPCQCTLPFRLGSLTPCSCAFPLGPYPPAPPARPYHVPGPQDNRPGADMATAAAPGAVEPVAAAPLESHGHHWESRGPYSWPGPSQKLFAPRLNPDSSVTVSKTKRRVFKPAPAEPQPAPWHLRTERRVSLSRDLGFPLSPPSPHTGQWKSGKLGRVPPLIGKTRRLTRGYAQSKVQLASVLMNPRLLIEGKGWLAGLG